MQVLQKVMIVRNNCKDPKVRRCNKIPVSISKFVKQRASECAVLS